MTTTMKSSLQRASFALLIATCGASLASAATIYRETFSNSDTANRKTPNVYGWQAYNSSGARRHHQRQLRR